MKPFGSRAHPFGRFSYRDIFVSRHNDFSLKFELKYFELGNVFSVYLRLVFARGVPVISFVSCAEIIRIGISE